MEKESRSKSVLGGIFLLISFIGLFNILKFSTGNDIWYDEVFSLMFVRGSFADIIASTARDVHPPLYYIYLKGFADLVTMVMGDQAFFFAAKLASVFPWFILFLVDITYIRKRFGLCVAGIFALFLSVMPQIPIYFLEIRMYSLALLFVTLHILVAERLVDSRERNSWHNRILFFVLGIATAYTQYYACIATIGIYFAVVMLLILDRKEQNNGKKMRGVLLSALLSCILYIPWIPVLLRQMNNISGSYWIQPLTIRSIAGCVKFVILPEGNTSKTAYIIAGILLMAIAVAFAAGAGLVISRTIKSPY